MATNVQQYNTEFDANVKFTRAFGFFEDDYLTGKDVSAWTFSFQLLDSTNAVIWNLVNADFSRPETNKIQFSKTIADIAALADGLYTFSLKATNGTEFSNDEILNGYIRK